MGRARTYKPFYILFSRERSGDNPWTLAVELVRFTGRGRESFRHLLSSDDLACLRHALALLRVDNEALDDRKKTVNPSG